MKFIVVTPAFKGVSLHRPTQPLKLQSTVQQEQENGLGLDNVGGLQSDTSADGAEFEFDAGIVFIFTYFLFLSLLPSLCPSIPLCVLKISLFCIPSTYGILSSLTHTWREICFKNYLTLPCQCIKCIFLPSAFSSLIMHL